MDKKVPVSERALFQRIQRKLKAEGCKLVKTRGVKAISNFGSYYIVKSNNFVSACNIEDLEKLARECSALAAHEYLKDGD